MNERTGGAVGEPSSTPSKSASTCGSSGGRLAKPSAGSGSKLLLGIGKSKFTPNLTVAGKRLAAGDGLRAASSEPNLPASRRGDGAVGKVQRGRGRGGGRGRHKIVESEGVFSEGIGEQLPFGGGGGGGGHRGFGATSARYSSADIDSTAGAKVESVVVVTAAPQETDEQALTRLFQEAGSSSTVGVASEADVAADDAVKREAVVESGPTAPGVRLLARKGRSVKAPPSDDWLHGVRDGRLCLLQLPRFLAGMVANADRGAVAAERASASTAQPRDSNPDATVNEAAETKVETAPEPEKLQCHVLDSIPEGLLGKLLICRSGRMMLQLATPNGVAPKNLLVIPSMESDLSQKLASVKIADDQPPSHGFLYNYGEVIPKLLLVPDVDSLLDETQSLQGPI